MSTPPEPAFVASSISAAVAVILTIAQAVPNIDKRLARIYDIEREVGSVPPLVRHYYLWPQWFYKYTLIFITLVGIAMVLVFMWGLLHPNRPLSWCLEALKGGGIWLVGLWLVLGASMYTNLITRLTSCVLEYTSSQEPSWPALMMLTNLNENAKPLFVSDENARAFADWLIRTVRDGAQEPHNRADVPQIPEGADPLKFRQKLGNALLAANIIEEAHYRNPDFPRREWEGFYAAIGELVRHTELFSSDTLKTRYGEDDFYSEMLAAVNQRLKDQNVQAAAAQPGRNAPAKQEPVPVSPTLMQTLRTAFTALVADYDGNVTALDPGQDGWLKSRLQIATQNVERLGCFHDESMKAQFVKLANAWEVWQGLPTGEFVFPFSMNIAALFLDRGVILTTEDVKALRFDNQDDRQVVRAAEKAVVGHVIKLVELNVNAHEKWLPPRAMTTTGEARRWWIAYETDFRIWDYARRLHSDEELPNKDGLMRWKAAYGQVVRIK